MDIYQRIFEQIPDGALVVDAFGRIRHLNGRVAAMFGYAPGDLAGQPIEVLIPDRLRARHAGQRQRYQEAPGARAMGSGPVLFGRRSDGSEFLVDVMLSPLGDEGVLCIVRDVFARRHAESSLRESEEKLRGLYELSPLGIALTDMRGRFIEFNGAFQRICGYPAAELKSIDYWRLTPERYRGEEARQLESLERTGYYGPYEKEYVRKDGSSIPVCLNGLLITGRDGQKYIWSIVEDVSERVAARRALVELNATLERRVAERTREVEALSDPASAAAARADQGV